MKRAFVAIVLFAMLMPALAQDVILIESRITGSQEQPKVISIVPWQKPLEPEYFGQDIEGLGLAFDVFRPLERQTFIRELRYITATRK
ncbi:MAG TPA: hypothetical protein VIN71_04385 [Pseudomonadales bacterium]